MAEKLPANGSGRIRFVWGAGTRDFFLGIDQLCELQDKCRCGPPEIYSRLCEDRWRVEDISETLRLGLVGAGMAPTEASLEVIRYVHKRPLAENVAPAAIVVLAALLGPENAAVKKKIAEIGQPT